MLLELLNRNMLDSRRALAETFASARPFRHLVIDDFFETRFAEGLLHDFPGTTTWEFDWTMDGDSPAEARPPRGADQRPTFHEMCKRSDYYRRADQLVSSSEFRGFVGEMTGIQDLIYDPVYFGGGVHDKRHGQELDPHVDYNYHPKTGH